MKVRAIIGRGFRAVAPSAPVRRLFIYPHRSVRVVPITAVRAAVALGAASLVSIGFGLASAPLFRIYASIVAGLLAFAQIPVDGWSDVALFSIFGNVPAPDLYIPRWAYVPDSASLALILLIVILLIAYRKLSLARNFAGFCVVLLLCSAGSMAFNPAYFFDSLTFTQIWLRGETLVWLSLPWISSFLFILLQPNIVEGLLWVLGLQAYVFIFSAIRMTFCLGVLHISGLLFFPLLWFTLGILATVLVLLFAWSLCIHGVARTLWGGRKAWRF